MTDRPALTVRRAAERGHADHGWLQSAHTFSFAGYRDPRHTGHRALRVINDDAVAAGRGFGAHPHADMEIFSWVLDGALAHEDSIGEGSTVEAGGVQYMSAGSGVVHAEMNASDADPVRFLQVWLVPAERGTEPRYETLDPAPEATRGALATILSPDGRDGSIRSLAPGVVHAGRLDGDERIERELGAEGRRHGWLQVARGRLVANGTALERGDGVAIEGAGPLALEGGEGAEVLLFELD